MSKSDTKKDLDLLMKFLQKSLHSLPEFTWECHELRKDITFEKVYKSAWRLNQYGEKIWSKLSLSGKTRWFFLLNKPIRKVLKRRVNANTNN